MFCNSMPKATNPRHPNPNVTNHALTGTLDQIIGNFQNIDKGAF